MKHDRWLLRFRERNDGTKLDLPAGRTRRASGESVERRCQSAGREPLVWAALPRPPDLRLAGKSDLALRPDGDLPVSGLTGAGLPELVRTVRDLLVPPEDLNHPGAWVFDERLQEAMRDEP